MYLQANPDCKQKLLSEIIPSVEAVKDDISGSLSFETVMDFEYLHWVFNETLRICPAVGISGYSTMQEDVTLESGVTLEKG